MEICTMPMIIKTYKSIERGKVQDVEYIKTHKGKTEK